MTVFVSIGKTQEPSQVELVELKELKQHEKIDPEHLKELKEKIKSDDVLKRPIVVDRNTNIILDGEHRFNSLKELGFSKIPVIFVDYNLPEITVKSWRKGRHLTKQIVIEAGLTQKKLPSRTSRHMVRISSKLKHISFMQKRVDIPLLRLQ